MAYLRLRDPSSRIADSVSEPRHAGTGLAYPPGLYGRSNTEDTTINVAFSQKSSFNALVNDKGTGNPLYRISTPFAFSRQVTTFSYAEENDEGTGVIAEIEWRCLSQSILTYRGATLPIDKFLIPGRGIEGRMMLGWCLKDLPKHPLI